MGDAVCTATDAQILFRGRDPVFHHVKPVGIGILQPGISAHLLLLVLAYVPSVISPFLILLYALKSLVAEHRTLSAILSGTG